MRTLFQIIVFVFFAWALAQALSVGLDRQAKIDDAASAARQATVAQRAANLEVQSGSTFYVAP